MQENQPQDRNGRAIGIGDILKTEDGRRYKVLAIDDLHGSRAAQLECLFPVESGFERRWESVLSLWQAYEIVNEQEALSQAIYVSLLSGQVVGKITQLHVDGKISLDIYNELYKVAQLANGQAFKLTEMLDTSKQDR